MRHVTEVVVALLAGAAGGVLSTRALPDASAQTGGAIVVPVPPEGVVFRARTGSDIARVRSDSAGGGGVIEVLDAREHVAVRLRATGAGGVVELGTGLAAGHAVLPLARSLDDPGY
jgi:hypothetical protein